MEALFTSGSITTLILALMLVEFVVLLGLRTLRGAGPPLRQIVANLAAGFFLILALRAALTGGDWKLMALWLSAALAAHLADLSAQWIK